MAGKSGRTSREAREAYNGRTYARYTFRVRMDSPLYEDIEAFMRKDGTSLNWLVEDLLKKHFLRNDVDGTIEGDVTPSAIHVFGKSP